MKRAYVTGATGFVGLNLVKRLVEKGWQVTALHRESSDLSLLRPLDAELCVGDVTDKASLEKTMPDDVDAVFHVAASTNMWAPNNDSQSRINVEGTRHVVDVALAKNAKRFVHTSSVVAYIPETGDVLREDLERSGEGHWFNYFATKWASEQYVRAAVDRGLHAIIFQPGNILGPYELHNWSRLFRLIKEGDLPGTFPGGGPWCHVTSLVDAQIKAAEVADAGEAYLIGAVHASFADVGHRIAEMVGVKSPRRLPPVLLRAVGRLSGWASLLTRREPDVTPEIAHIGTIDFTCDCSKAERELDYREVSLQQMLDDTHAWLVQEKRL